MKIKNFFRTGIVVVFSVLCFADTSNADLRFPFGFNNGGWRCDNPQPGGTIGVYGNVQYFAQGESGDFYVRFVLSSNDRVDEADIRLGDDVRVRSISGGLIGGTGWVNRIIPRGTRAGRYYILVVADCNRNVAENNEGNNVYPCAQRITITVPNLRVGSGWLEIDPSLNPDRVAAGGRTTLTWRLKNDGNGTAGQFMVNYSLSNNTRPGNTSLWTEVVNRSQPGTERRQIQLQIPNDVAPGNYYVVIFVDIGDRVCESNENDNTSAVRITVTRRTPPRSPGEEQPNDVAENGVAAPATPSLSDCYPNPFNSTTHFQFDMPQAGNALVSVFGMDGREVTRLVNSFEEAGRHEVAWNATGVASGVYLIRFHSGSTTLMTRAMLLR